VISHNNRLFDIFFEGKDRAEFARFPYRKGNVALGYVICVTPRSGSTFLTHLLKENNSYGNPDEWLNYDSIGAIISEEGIVNFDQYLNFLWENYSSEAGVFGVELSYPHFAFLHEMAPLENVLGENIRWFYLVRENIVAQAISLYVANVTGYFHSYMERTDDIKLTYNAQEIIKNINMLVDQEAAFERLFTARGICPVRLSYESMMLDTHSTVALFRNVLSVGQGKEIVKSDTIKKIGGEINAEFEEKFRREEGGFLEDIIKRRMPVVTMSRTV